ncbi:ketosteroid isomerase [Caulobacter sp. Root1455]|uniref:YybH family protein n=1 Tax=Caulobacter sp. Root1455 TaxID=1736465 RepID=UPI0006F21AD7|nr:nuclear transport factor 2 family protein [Caulobacter sp. Root1455]KQY98893.1 ketosteroid isomerase [Caulobacter sp. Root1455]
MPDAAADEVAIRRVIDAWTKALHDKDAQGATADLTADFALYSLAPPLGSTGPDPAGLQAWFDTWSSPIGYDLPDLEIAAAGDVAFAHGLAHMTGTKTDGEIADLWFRCTLGLRKRGGAWKIVHAHESVPFLMDGSFKAALDLKP